MVLRTHEDKRVEGGVIASLSIPWGFSKGDNDLGGYHLIWPRDLVETAGAFLAISPWLFGFADFVWVPHLVFGLLEMGASATTVAYPAYESERTVTETGTPI